MAWVGAAISAAGSILGGIAGARSARKTRRALERRKKENQDWYNKNYNEDATQRADAQRLLTLTEENIKNRNKAAAGVQAVIGGTDESVAAAKQANNNALADTISQINANAVYRKDRVESQYLNRKDDLEDQLIGLNQQKQSNISGATQGVGSAASAIAELLAKKKS